MSIENTTESQPSQTPLFEEPLQKDKNNPMENLGLNIRIIGVALLLTVCFYGLLNWLGFIPWLSISARNARLGTHELQSEKATDFMRLTDCSRELERWVIDNTTPGTGNDVKQMVTFIQSIKANANANEREAMEKKLKWIIKGKPDTFLLFYMNVTLPTGKEALTEITDENWRDSLEREDFAREKRLFLEKMLDQLIARQAVAIHSVRRFNGTIQFLTVFVGMLVLCLLYGRKKKVEQVFLSYASGNAISLPPVANVETCIYKPLSFMISLLPSLGFIGTVLGMGTALLHANQLFTSTDKQAAIGKMTQELGFAFDTTLIALVVAMILGTLLTWVRTREYDMFSRFISMTPEITDEVEE